jgi:glycosyltransferase involved in cell wall biosynthesis
MLDSPRISVIVPVYNGERYLAEAVGSVLDQALRPLEVIVVDDGSTDATAQIMAGLSAEAPLPVRAIHQSNRGPAAARNRGLEVAQGELMAFLDADDWWPPTSLSLRCACLLRYPHLSGVIGATQLMVETAGHTGICLTPWGVPQPTLNLGCALIRLSAFEQVGFFNEDFTYAEDADWLLRARELGLRLGVHPGVALMARRHAGNMTNEIEPSVAYLARALRQSLTRRLGQVDRTGDNRRDSPQLAGLVRCDL